MFSVQQISTQGSPVRYLQTRTPLVGETQTMCSYLFMKSPYKAEKKKLYSKSALL